MKLKLILVAFVLAFALVSVAGVHAQTIGTMPALYNVSGQQVNVTSAPLPAGTYYLQANGTQAVIYYGDGTYFDYLTGLYAGSIYNPFGQAGFYTIPAVTTTVGIPNTGAGGDAASVRTTLALAALAAVSGALYLSRSRYEAAK